MVRITIRKLHEETGRIVDRAARGEAVLVQRRGVPVAEIRGVSAPRAPRIPDLGKRYARFPRVGTDSGRFLEEDRR